MNSICTSILLSTGLLVTGVSAGLEIRHVPLERHERTELRSRESETLVLRRAGSTKGTLDQNERTELRRLEQQSNELESKRAGEFSNNTLLTILVIIGIVALVLIIA